MKSVKKVSANYRLARLYDAGGDLSKPWIVIYYAYSLTALKLVRKRVTVQGHTDADRRKDAAAIIKEINQQLKAGATVDGDPIPKPQPVAPATMPVAPATLGDALAYFLDTKKASIKANSHKTYRSSIKLFRTYLTENYMLRLRLSQFKTAHAFAYMDYVLTDLGLSNKSHNKHLGVLETLFNFYMQRQYIKANPFVTIKPLAERPGRHTAFTVDQVAKVKQACELAQDHQFRNYDCSVCAMCWRKRSALMPTTPRTTGRCTCSSLLPWNDLLRNTTSAPIRVAITCSHWREYQVLSQSMKSIFITSTGGY